MPFSNFVHRQLSQSEGARCDFSILGWSNGWLRLICLNLTIFLSINLLAQGPPNTSDRERSSDLYLAGVAFAKTGKLDQAISTFEKALDKNGQDPLLLDATGAAYSLKGNSEQAEKYFRRCLDRDPGFIPARKNLAITHFTTGQYDLAAVEFQKLRDISTASGPVANLFLGMIAEKNSQHSQAQKLLELSGVLLSRYPDAILALAQADVQLIHTEKAQNLLAKLEAGPGVTGVQYLEAAKLYSQIGQDQKALAALDHADAKGNRTEQVDYQRALTLNQLNRFAEASVILKSLVVKHPDGETLNLLAHVAQKNGDLALAMQSLQQAAKLNPSAEENYLDFSSICSDYGNYQVALEAADVGLEHLPNSYRLLIQKAVVLENLGRLEEAEALLKRAEQSQKENSVALLTLSIIQTHAGQLRDAEATLDSALRSYPENYYMHYQLGKVLLQLREGNPSAAYLSLKAKQAFEDTIRCNPSFADSYYQLSKLYPPGSSKLAEQNLVKCLRSDPNHAPAEYALARLYLSTGKRAEGQALIDRFERQRQADKQKEKQKPRIEVAQN